MIGPLVCLANPNRSRQQLFGIRVFAKNLPDLDQASHRREQFQTIPALCLLSHRERSLQQQLGLRVFSFDAVDLRHLKKRCWKLFGESR